MDNTEQAITIEDPTLKMKNFLNEYQVGDKIDCRDKYGIWRQCIILNIIQTESLNKYIYEVTFVGYNIQFKIEISPLNICSCHKMDNYCFQYNPTHLQWSNHMVAAPNTQSKRWKELGMTLFGQDEQSPKDNNALSLRVQYKLTLIVFGFMRQNYEEIYNKLIPMDIKQIIYLFWEYWSRLTKGNVFRIKNENNGLWESAVVRYTTFSGNNTLTFAYCPNVLKIGDRIDAKDCDGKWYLAEIISIKRAKKKFPMKPPKKKKKFKKFCAIYVHFLEFGDRFNEWIFIKNNVMCSCSAECLQGDHKITFPETQSDTNPQETRVLHITDKSFCDCVEKCENNDHRLMYTENYRLVTSKDLLLI